MRLLFLLLMITMMLISGCSCGDDDDDDDDDTVFVELIEGGGTGHLGTSIVRDGSDATIIAAVKGRSLYVYRQGTIDLPTEEFIDENAAYPDMAIDGSDKLHIAYYDNLNEDLKYATDTSGSWQTQTIYSAGTTGLYPSIALDDLGMVHAVEFGETASWGVNFPQGYTD